MSLITNFLSLFVFVFLYVGSGIYFTMQGVQNAFYQLSPAVAILPAIVVEWLLSREPRKERLKHFLDGVRHRDIITMCLIFLLAGAFSMVTKSIGSIDATVNLALSLVPTHLLLIGVFLTGAFISTAIGTSMGTIATLAPLAAGLAHQGAFPATIGIATVVSGAMFGDSLSLVSDTTIAAVLSQEADYKKKFLLNFRVAAFAAGLTMIVLFFGHAQEVVIPAKDYSLLLVLPYVFLIMLALTGVNVFMVLLAALGFAWVIGFWVHGYSLLVFSKDIAHGFTTMHDIMVLSLLVGGLSGLASKKTQHIIDKLTALVDKRGGKKVVQLLIAKIVSLFDILLANNTVAIVFSGEIARSLSRKYHIPPHYSAAWLDIFSCVFQGIIPYGAQILLASSVAGISPLAVMGQVYFCYFLGGVALLTIFFTKRFKE